MKILNLEFKNINSLYGRWNINFSTPEFTDYGVFAITGPTGSGKSTILDAITLALYGQTPRQDKSGDNRKNVMSYGENESYSEIIFSNMKGQYRCRWQQKYIKKRDGTFSIDTHQEIVDDITNKVIASKPKEYLSKIKDITGLDFNRFIHMILLSQGNFAIFLKATEKDKAPILEQITGTEIYTAISKKVFERNKEEKAKLENIKSQMSSIRLLDESESFDINVKLILFKYQKERLLQEEIKLKDICESHKQYTSLNLSISDLVKKKDELNSYYDSMKEDFNDLMYGEKANIIEPLYKSLVKLREEYKNTGDTIVKLNLLIKDLENNVDLKKKELEDLESENSKMSTKKKKLDEIITDVNKIDLLIRSNKEQLWKEEEKKNKYDKSINDISALINTTKSEVTKNEDYIKNLEQELSKYELLNSFSSKRDYLERLIMDTNSYSELLNKINKQLEFIKKKVVEFEKKAEEINALKNEKSDDIKSLNSKKVFLIDEKNSLLTDKSMNELIITREYIGYRKHLEPGEACPICGSVTHIYDASRNYEQELVDINNRITRLNGLDDEISVINGSIDKAKDEYTQIESNANRNDSELQKAKEQYDQEESRYKEACHKKEMLVEDIDKSLEPFLGFIGDISDKHLYIDIITKLENISSSIKLKVSTRDEVHKSLLEQKNELKRLEDRISIEAKVHGEIIQEIKELSSVLDSYKSERLNKFGDSDYNKESDELNKLLDSYDSRIKTCRESMGNYSKDLERYRGEMNIKRENHNNVALEIKDLEKEFDEKLHEFGFISCDEFLDKLISPEKLNSIKNIKVNTENDIARTNLLISDNTIKLNNLDPDLRHVDIDAIFDLMGVIKELIESTLTDIGRYEQIIKNNEDAKLDYISSQDKYRYQESYQEGWEHLNLLIGSSDGKKYREFVQTITFDNLLIYANLELNKMSSRYILTSAGNLHINVIDSELGGAIRDASNLSGGETFIVSLALALGLSRIAGGNSNLNSFFLDEGFGTLDADSMEVALETLFNLKTESKLIGIVSHRDEVKERISLQIEVIPTGNGRSKLVGAGLVS